MPYLSGMKPPPPPPFLAAPPPPAVKLVREWEGVGVWPVATPPPPRVSNALDHCGRRARSSPGGVGAGAAGGSVLSRALACNFPSQAFHGGAGFVFGSSFMLRASLGRLPHDIKFAVRCKLFSFLSCSVLRQLCFALPRG